MCYSGKCVYENYWGDCTKNFSTHPWKIGEPIPPCEPLRPFELLRGRQNDMKVLNKKKKLKYSKMLIDYDTYENICKKWDTTLGEHIARIEVMQNNPDLVPDMIDVSIMFEVYTHITKVIHKRG